MKYWTRIQAENVEIIQAKTIKFLTDNRDKLKSTFCPLIFQDYIKAVPEILTTFSKDNIKPVAAAVYVMHKNTDVSPHKDFTRVTARINIPIVNCDNTWTLFYKLKEGAVGEKVTLLPSGVPYRSFDFADVEEVDRVSITEATVIRPQEIHSVIMNEAATPRITLTLTCSPDPGYLLED
jgi:hypothetical protein